MSDLEINEITPEINFGTLIWALYQKTQKSVLVLVVLIDEYYSLVTRNMGNSELAQANADVLHNFFAALKRPEVSEHNRFTLVTGITRYGLTSMDSGANHLVYILLDQKYAGLCGFNLEELIHILPIIWNNPLQP
jgi:hypothetical protein